MLTRLLKGNTSGARLLNLIIGLFIILFLSIFCINGCATTVAPTSSSALPSPVLTPTSPCEAAIDPAEFFPMDGTESPWSIVRMQNNGPFAFLDMIADDPFAKIPKALVMADMQSLLVVSYCYVCKGQVYAFMLNLETGSYERYDHEFTPETLKILKEELSVGQEV